MNSSPIGRRIRLSVARRMIADFMWAGSNTGRVSVTRPVAFRDLMTARGDLGAAPSWTAIFVKGFALVAAEIPELRRVYLGLPWPHLYEYADSTVCIIHERWIMGDLGLLPLRFQKPDAVPMPQLSEMIRRAAAAPTEEARFHRKLIALARLPLLARRLILAVCMNVPRLRREMGTYGVSSAARWRTDLGTSRTPQPCLLSYGPADADGNVVVRTHIRSSRFRRSICWSRPRTARGGPELLDSRGTARPRQIRVCQERRAGRGLKAYAGAAAFCHSGASLGAMICDRSSTLIRGL